MYLQERIKTIQHFCCWNICVNYYENCANSYCCNSLCREVDIMFLYLMKDGLMRQNTISNQVGESLETKPQTSGQVMAELYFMEQETKTRNTTLWKQNIWTFAKRPPTSVEYFLTRERKLCRIAVCFYIEGQLVTIFLYCLECLAFFAIFHTLPKHRCLIV